MAGRVQRAYRAPARVSRLACPSCGEHGLRLLYVAWPGWAEDTGVPAFWCDACLRGLMLCATPVAPGAARNQSDEVDVPNYTLVHEA